MSEIRGKIRTALADGKLTREAIEAATKITGRQMENALYHMRNAGELLRTGAAGAYEYAIDPSFEGTTTRQLKPAKTSKAAKAPTKKKPGKKTPSHHKPHRAAPPPRGAVPFEAGDFTAAFTHDNCLLIVRGDKPQLFTQEETHAIADVICANFATN